MAYDAYRAGLKGGDIHLGLCSLFLAGTLDIFSAKKLEELTLETMAKHLDQMIQSKQALDKWNFRSLYQAVLNLRTGPKTTALDGSIMTEEELFRNEKRSPVSIAAGYVMKIWLAAFFGKFEDGTEAARSSASIKDNIFGTAQAFIYEYMTALCFYGAARKSKSRRLFLEGRKSHNLLKKWVQNGNPNGTGYLKLLEAESFEAAVVANGRLGYIHDQWLSNMRLAEFALEQGDVSEAKYRFDLALELYEEWGASFLVEHLRKSSNQFC